MEIIIRQTIEDIYKLKLKMLETINTVREIDRQEWPRDELDAFFPWHISWHTGFHGDNGDEKFVDKVCWSRIVLLCQLEKYMLCTEYAKMQKDIEDGKTPVFNIENAKGWVAGLIGLIEENIKLMCKRVYQELICQTYSTEKTWKAEKKKRNNNGVDKFFILSTHDYSRIFAYWNSRPTITDDLEKVCYILDGKTIPEKTLIEKARVEQIDEIQNDYFTVRFCKNGNTHYKIEQETLRRLNLIGPDGNTIGEKIKIKIVER